MEICSSSRRRDKQHKKTPLVIKTAAYQSGTIRLFLGSLLAFCGTSFRFYPQKVLRLCTNTSNSSLGNMGGQEMGTLGHAPWEEWNLPTETYRDWFPIIAWLQKTETHLLTNKHLPKIFPRPQVSELAAWTPVGHPALCIPCPWIQPTPNPQWLTCELYSMHLGSCNSSAIPEKKKKKLNFCSFELASVNFFIWVHRYRSKGIESRDSMEICTTVFVVTLFTVAKRRNQPKQGPIERWMGKQNVAIYTM